MGNGIDTKDNELFNLGDLIVLSKDGIDFWNKEGTIEIDKKYERHLRNKIFQVNKFSTMKEFLFVNELGNNQKVRSVYKKYYRLATPDEIKIHQIKKKIFKK